MISNLSRCTLAIALASSLALSACKKNEPVPPPVAAEPAPAPAPPPEATVAPAATVSVTSVNLGTALAADSKLSTPSSGFGKKDTIIAAVSTVTSDPNATVPGKLGARWTFQDGQVVNEETRDLQFAGAGVTDFRISKPDGWPAGKYKVDISLDGAVVQSPEFTIK